MKNWSDQKLFNAIREGDSSALSALFLRHHNYLKHYGLRIVSDSYLVDDCIQELFIYILDSCKRLHEVIYVKAYLFKALRRRILEKSKQEQRLKNEEKILFRVNIQFSPQDLNIQNDEIQARHSTLLDALNGLAWRQRESIYLRYFNGLNTREIAEIMGITNQTVLNTLYQALKKLRSIEEFKLLGR